MVPWSAPVCRSTRPTRTSRSVHQRAVQGGRPRVLGDDVEGFVFYDHGYWPVGAGLERISVVLRTFSWGGKRLLMSTTMALSSGGTSALAGRDSTSPAVGDRVRCRRRGQRRYRWHRPRWTTTGHSVHGGRHPAARSGHSNSRKAGNCRNSLPRAGAATERRRATLGG